MKAKKAILIFFSMVSIGLLVLHIVLDRYEKYYISGIDFQLYNVIERDSLSECFSLKSTEMSDFDPKGSYVLGLRLNRDYQTIRHEGLGSFFDTYDDSGDKGHTDTIVSISLLSNESRINLNSIFHRPSTIRAFTITDSALANIRLVGDCYRATPNIPMDSLIQLYNSSVAVNYSLFDHVFYIVTPGEAKEMLSTDVELVSEIKKFKK